MTLSTPTHESTPVTTKATQTTTPGIANAKPYSEIAAELPSPAQLDTSNYPRAGPAIADNFTIPGDHIEPEDIPWNSAGIPWRSWRSKTTTTTALYNLGARHAAPEGSQRRAVHAVFSPPQADVNTPRAIRHWRAKASDIAQSVGIRGGMVAFHGYRIHSDTVDAFKEHIYNTPYADTATDVLLWEWLRRGEWRNHVQWGPHIHIVGLCEELEDYDGDGVLQHLRTFDGYDRSVNTSAVAEHRAVAKDIIDHVTFSQTDPGPPVGWFGELEGDEWWSAKQHCTDTTLENIRDELINGDSNPDS